MTWNEDHNTFTELGILTILLNNKTSVLRVKLYFVQTWEEISFAAHAFLLQPPYFQHSVHSPSMPVSNTILSVPTNFHNTKILFVCLANVIRLNHTYFVRSCVENIQFWMEILSIHEIFIVTFQPPFCVSFKMADDMSKSESWNSQH